MPQKSSISFPNILIVEGLETNAVGNAVIKSNGSGPLPGVSKFDRDINHGKKFRRPKSKRLMDD